MVNDLLKSSLTEMNKRLRYKRGIEDIKSNLPYCEEYERWNHVEQFAYELGRLHAIESSIRG